MNEAIEEIKSVLGEYMLKAIHLPCKDNDLLKFALPKISEALKEFDSFEIVYEVQGYGGGMSSFEAPNRYIQDTLLVKTYFLCREQNKIKVVLFGEQMVVEEVAASISGLHKEYTTDESIKIPPNLTAEVEGKLSSLSSEYLVVFVNVI